MPGTSGDSFYDAADVQRRYTDHRDGAPHLSPNHVMEEPAVLAEIGDPAGLRVLDLGCGDGEFGVRLLASGARSYHGVDGSTRMIDVARANLAGTGGTVALAAIEDVDPAPGSVDLVTARLSLHYVADLSRVMAAAARALAVGGRVVLTVVHPVVTSNDKGPTGPRTSWTVDDYFDTGPRSRDWLGSRVVWHHRTIENHVDAVIGAGLTVTAVRECEPRPDRFDGHLDELRRRRRIPLFLLLAASRER